MARNKIVAVRLDAELKEEVGEIFLDLGLTTSQATVLFYKQVLLHKGIPFELRLPGGEGRDVSRDGNGGNGSGARENAELFADVGA